MSVYFIRVGGYFKIGHSDDPERRFDRLHASGTRYTFPLGVSTRAADRVLYKVVEGDLTHERQIHAALDEFGVGLEWFLDEPALVAFVDSLDAKAGRGAYPLIHRAGGWCEREYLDAQAGRAERELGRYYAKRTPAA